MVKNIVKDVMFLKIRSTAATKNDLQTARDLTDTLNANSDICVGLAANMIGVSKSIIAVMIFGMPVVMINPRIISHSKESYDTEEGCLSLDGARKTKRWESIKVSYFDMAMKPQTRTFGSYTAQIIQHEIDHCNGILI